MFIEGHLKLCLASIQFLVWQIEFGLLSLLPRISATIHELKIWKSILKQTHLYILVDQRITGSC